MMFMFFGMLLMAAGTLVLAMALIFWIAVMTGENNE